MEKLQQVTAFLLRSGIHFSITIKIAYDMSEMTDENCKTKKNIKNTPLSVTERLPVVY